MPANSPVPYKIHGGVFGTANWMNRWQFESNGFHKDIGLPLLGGFHSYSSFRRQSLPIFANDNGHMITVAPTRTGKGTCHIIPNLLHRDLTSMFVLDVKSENHDKTNLCRKDILGQKIYRFSPFRSQDSDSWNPLEAIQVPQESLDKFSLEQENSRYLASLMVTPSPNSSEPYWENAAISLIQAFIMFVAYSPIYDTDRETEFLPRERSMAEVRRLMTLPIPSFKKVIEAMVHEDTENSFLRQLGGTIMQTMESEKQFAGVITQALEHTVVWSYDRVTQVTKEHHIDFSSFREIPSTLYLMIPPDVLNEYRPLIRAMVGWAIRELKQSYDDSKHRNEPPVVFILDEFPALGHMEPIQQGLAYLAGYGIRLWFFIQNISQLKEHYPKSWETFLANSATKIFFGVTDYDTAKLVSNMSGMTTVQNIQQSHSRQQTHQTGGSEGGSRGGSSGWGQGGHSSGSNWGSSWGTNWSHSEGTTFGINISGVGRALLNPDEVLRLSSTEQIVFFQGHQPIRGIKLPYFINDILTERAGEWTGE